MPVFKFVPLDDYYNSVAVVLRGLDPQYSGIEDGDMAMVSYEDLKTDTRSPGWSLLFVAILVGKQKQ